MAVDYDRQERQVADRVTLSLDIGGQLVLKVPIDSNNTGSGAFPHAGPVVFGGSTYTLTLGFGVSDPNVGIIEVTENSDCLEVKYTHNKPANQRVCFFAADSRVAILDIIRVPVHDHSSIYQGGPAHGTYYSEGNLQGG